MNLETRNAAKNSETQKLSTLDNFFAEAGKRMRRRNKHVKWNGTVA